MLSIEPIAAFDDNYIWLIHDSSQAFVVDPGDAAPVLAALREIDAQCDENPIILQAERSVVRELIRQGEQQGPGAD